ncbi:lysylphosphatidylglycerol synthase domain-containing protein [Stutzerimonas tarimensis]|uniref:Lysylphosphatidylglycerol synthase domain-containing protein n=1 Tax=Stutzerimonas tarimensis TaxID=1507735 RepID=A0ABV7T3S7_9GAMM
MTQSDKLGRIRSAWPKIKKILSYIFIFAVVGLLVGLATTLDWREVGSALRNYEASTLLLAGGVTAASYLLYAFFDVLGKHYVRHDLPVRQVLPVTFVCYAFTMNLSAWIGGIALRYRLYGRLGLRPAQITRVFTLSILTNWLGYTFLAGLAFSLGWVRPPAEWDLGATALRLLGLGLIVVTLIYLGACAFSKRRAWKVRGHEIHLPSIKLALMQIIMGAANWSLMALIVYLMLLQRVDYLQVLGILMISSIAGVVAHIPAGLGVIEAVFVALLAGQMNNSSIVAGLIGYRVIYYLVPLAFAALTYFTLEARAKKLRQGNGATDAQGSGAADTPAQAKHPG